MCAVARYYEISSNADRGDIFIVHDQKSSYRTPLLAREGEKDEDFEKVIFILIFYVYICI